MSGFRKHWRAPTDCNIELNHSVHGLIIAKIRNVSETGIFLSSRYLSRVIKVGDMIETKSFQDHVDEHQSQPHTGFCYSTLRVVRKTDEGIALTR